MIWAGFLEKPPEVVYTQPPLMLVTACGGRDAPHAGATCFAIVAIGRGRGPLKALLAPLLATFDTLLCVVGGDVGRCLPAAAWGHLPTSLGTIKHDRLVAGGALCGNAAGSSHVFLPP
jgi:hypothetical protein